MGVSVKDCLEGVGSCECPGIRLAVGIVKGPPVRSEMRCFVDEGSSLVFG